MMCSSATEGLGSCCEDQWSTMFHTEGKHFNRALSQVELHRAGVNPDISLIIHTSRVLLSLKQTEKMNVNKILKHKAL